MLQLREWISSTFHFQSYRPYNQSLNTKVIKRTTPLDETTSVCLSLFFVETIYAAFGHFPPALCSFFKLNNPDLF